MEHGKTGNRKERDKRRTGILVLSFVLSFILLSLVYYIVVDRHITQEKTRYGYIAVNESDHIMRTVDGIMARTNTLRALVQDHHGGTDFFDAVAADVYDDVLRETGVTLKNLAIAPRGVVSHVYPYKGNEALIGFNYFDLDKQGNAEAVEAYEKGETVLTNPFPLVQGGIGMAGRTPVLLTVGDEPQLWGIVSVTINCERLIDALMLKHLESMGIDYTLSYIDDKGEAYVANNVGAIGDDAVVNRFTVRNLTWELALRPKDGWSSGREHIVWCVIFLLLSCFVAKFVDMFFKLQDSNRVLRSMLVKFFDMVFKLQESNEALKNMSEHDAMTGLRNRRAYSETIEAFLKKVPEDCCVMMADINGLKEVNDTRGHKAGDELIIGAADCLRRAFKGNDRIFRMGGDEFCVIAEAPPEAMERDIATFERLTAEWKGNYIESLSVSCGMASSREHQTIADLVKDADQRMYECKERYYMMSGKDRRKRQQEGNE